MAEEVDLAVMAGDKVEFELRFSHLQNIQQVKMPFICRAGEDFTFDLVGNPDTKITVRSAKDEPRLKIKESTCLVGEVIPDNAPVGIYFCSEVFAYTATGRNISFDRFNTPTFRFEVIEESKAPPLLLF